VGSSGNGQHASKQPGPAARPEPNRPAATLLAAALYAAIDAADAAESYARNKGLPLKLRRVIYDLQRNKWDIKTDDVEDALDSSAPALAPHRAELAIMATDCTGKRLHICEHNSQQKNTAH
jgi:hypothetical protein